MPATSWLHERARPVGYAKYLADPPPRAVFASYLVRFRVHDDVDSKYVGYVVESSAYKQFIVANAGGAAQPNANAKTLGSFLVPLPDRETQRRIAAALSAFDELIEVNERRIELLENLSRSLYREWFTRFRFPGHDGVPASGSLPDGWTVGRLADVADVNASTAKARDLPDPLRYLDISSVSARRIEDTQVMPADEAPSRARRRVRDGDTAWATVRPNRRAHALLHSPAENLIASTGLAILSPTAVPASFLFEHTSTQEFADYLMGRATGAAYPAVRPDDFREAPIAIPPCELLSAFDAFADRAQRLTSGLMDANRTLGRTRDLLLPRLITGRLDISDVDLGDLSPGEDAA